MRYEKITTKRDENTKVHEISIYKQTYIIMIKRLFSGEL